MTDITHLRSDEEILAAIRNDTKMPGTVLCFPYLHCQSREHMQQLCRQVREIVGNTYVAYCGATGFIYWGQTEE